jgi:uncharacterized protein (TIRG00374 family)
MSAKSTNPVSRISKIAAVLLGALLMTHLFQGVNFNAVFALIGKIGLPIVLALAPYLCIGVFDSMAWKITIESVGQKVAYWRLLHIRLCTEALLVSLPGGAAVAEAAKPILLKRHFGIQTPEGIAIIAVKKGILGIAHGFYLALSASLGFTALKTASEAIIGVRGLEWLAWFASVLMFLLFGGATILFLYGGISQKLHQLLMSIPVAPLRNWLLAQEQHFLETDAHLGKFHQAGKRRIGLAVLMFFFGWMFETVETILILSLLGVQMPFGALMCMETTMSLIRAVIFVLPAGLGVQDYGYVLFLKSFGVPDAESVGVAFVLIKRAKELIWVFVGYSLLGFGGVKPKELSENENPAT